MVAGKEKKSRFGQGYVDRDTICNFGTMPRKIPPSSVGRDDGFATGQPVLITDLIHPHINRKKIVAGGGDAINTEEIAIFVTRNNDKFFAVMQ